MSQSVVVNVLQDQMGFLWFATQDGLNRYDGYDFTVFKHSNSDSNSISDNYATFLMQDKAGVIWVGTNGGGLNKFDARSEKFTALLNNPNVANSLTNNSIRYIFEDSKERLWVATYGGGLNKLNRQNLTFTSFQNDADNPASLIDNRVYCIAEDNNKNLWIGTENGLDYFNPESGKFIHIRNITGNKNSLSGNFIRSLFIDKNNKLFVGTNNSGLNTLNLKDFYYYLNENPNTVVDKLKFTIYKHSPNDDNSISGNSVNSIIKDKHGYIWLGVWDGGLNLFDESNQTFSNYTYSASNPNSLSQNDIITLYQDRTGIIWIGTYSGGINKLNRNWDSFKMFRHNPDISGSLSHNRVFSILKDNFGTLWVGTWGGGLNRYNKQKKIFDKYSSSDNIYSLSDNRVTQLYIDKQGDLWVGTMDGGLNKFNYTTQTFFNSRNGKMPLSIAKERITAIEEDNHGNFWVGTLNNGLVLYDRKNGTAKKFTNKPDDLSSISNSRITSIFEDSQRTLWIGTYFGLNILNTQTEKFKRFVKDQNDPQSLQYDRISKVVEDKTGTIWIGTLGGGLYQLDKKEREKGKYVFKEYNKENGLSDDFIYNILVDDHNRLWLTTNNGLNVFDPTIGLFINYNASDGLQSNEFKEGAYYDEKTGEMFVGGINGFNSFYPDSLKLNLYPPQVAFTGFKIFNEPVTPGLNSPLKSSITYTKEITLPHSDYVFSIDFSALHYSSPDENKYAYYLDGFDQKWIYTDAKHRYATYTNLSGGTYTFYLKASNPDGIWTHEPITLKITVIPPFYQTTVFKVILLFLVLFVIFLVSKINNIRITERNKLLEIEVEKRTHELRELNTTKDKFFSIIAHDLKGPFNFFLGSTSLLKEEIDNLTKEEIAQIGSTLNSSAQKFYKLLENLLDWTRVQMGVLKPEPVAFSLNEIANDVIKLLNDSALKKEIEINCIGFNDVANIDVYADPNMISTVIRNLISNAIKFTPRSGKIIIEILKLQDKLKISVQDTGMGMSESEIESIFDLGKHRSKKGTDNEEGSGLGLILCKEFIEKNEGTFRVKSELDKGTTAWFSIPIAKKV